MEIQATLPFDLSSDADWELLCKIRLELKRRPKRKVQSLSPAEEAVFEALPEKQETPTLEIMRQAGLGKMNLSGLIRDLVAEKAGMNRQELITLILERYPNRWVPSQIVGAINQQSIHNIICAHGRLYMSEENIPLCKSKSNLNRSEIVRKYVKENPGLKQREVVNAICEKHPELQEYSVNGIVSALRYQRKQLVSRDGGLYLRGY